MRRVFIDCGSNLGQGLNQFASMYSMDSSWIVETYEPNKDLIETLKTNISALPMNVKVYDKAVLDFDGEILFSKMLEDSQGSSVECLMYVAECADVSSPAYRKHDSISTVPCIDISTILSSYSEEDFLVVKLDVEGSEFRIVRRMLADGSIKKINDLYIEWHTRYIENENEQTESQLLQEIQAVSPKTSLHRWH